VRALGRLARMLDVVAPPSCAGCGLPGAQICAACRAALVAPGPVFCGGCGHPLAVAANRCAACRGPVRDARHAVLYTGPVPRLVSALKDDRQRALAGPLGELMAHLPPPPEGAPLVPVPLTPERLRERGFNQSALLAERLAVDWDLEMIDLLRRRAGEGHQRGAPRSRRERQVVGVFTTLPGAPPPEVVCLVDDVHTTGSTLAAAARALRAAGARLVVARCLARAVRDAPEGPWPPSEDVPIRPAGAGD
jgi:predicted amidophosphoribosyltransferase